MLNLSVAVQSIVCCVPPMQYTCITASERYVALGANTGGVYCFHRDGLKYIRILANRVSG